MTEHEKYMQRCLQLAMLGTEVAPNPRVGAVLVYQDKIIGEGYHARYGKAHAEVNCLNSVSETNKKYVAKSTLYVSLEPCIHFGKTPPCVDLIIAHKIPVVVIACRDSFDKVNGTGVQKLRAAGIQVIEAVQEAAALKLNNSFFTFHNKKRPFILLKWAQSKNGQIAKADFSRVKITHAITDILVHKWRSEAAAILVGKNTALYDNPLLTNRLWKGKSPIRIVMDGNLNLPPHLHLFDTTLPTIVFNYKKNGTDKNITYHLLKEKHQKFEEVLHTLWMMNIQRVLIEGGAAILQSFIDAGYWDEARVITNESCFIEKGIAAPELKNFKIVNEEKIFSDNIQYFCKLDKTQ